MLLLNNHNNYQIIPKCSINMDYDYVHLPQTWPKWRFIFNGASVIIPYIPYYNVLTVKIYVFSFFGFFQDTNWHFRPPLSLATSSSSFRINLGWAGRHMLCLCDWKQQKSIKNPTPIHDNALIYIFSFFGGLQLWVLLKRLWIKSQWLILECWHGNINVIII